MDAPKTGKTITVKASEAIRWSPSGEVIQALTANTPVNFSELEEDTVTVTAKFTDGQTLSKTIILSYDNDGYLCAKLLL